MVNKNNIYDIDTTVEGIAEKKRYTALERAKMVIALQGRIDSTKSQLNADLLESINATLDIAEKSNSTEVSKYAVQLRNRFTKILG